MRKGDKMTEIQKSYGISESTDIPMICKAVCNALGNGSNDVANEFIYRIAKAETGAGTIKDTTINSAGNGLYQFDKLPFYDNVSRYTQRDIDKCIKYLSIDPTKTTWEELQTNILKGTIACRLHFKPYREEIPKDIVGQAKYWKRYYNTLAGKGSVKHFLEMNGFDMELYKEYMEI